VTQLIPLIDAIPSIGGKVGAPLRKPAEVMGDRGYHSDLEPIQHCHRGHSISLPSQVRTRSLSHRRSLLIHFAG